MRILNIISKIHLFIKYFSLKSKSMFIETFSLIILTFKNLYNLK